MILMLHRLSHDPITEQTEGCYLGSVEVDEDTHDEPLEMAENAWKEFRFTEDPDNQFIEFLADHNFATEVMYDNDSPNLPLQVYLD